MSVDLSNISLNGMPNLGAIKTLVSAQGEGRLRLRTAIGDIFAFHIKRNAAGTYDAFIESNINFRGRPAHSHATHRLDMSAPRPRICFSQSRPPRDLPTAIALTIYWAECTVRYIRTGVWA